MHFGTSDRRRVLAAIGALIALLCLAPCGRAEEPIRWKFTVGEKLEYNITQDMNMAMNMGASGQMNSNAHQVMDMTWDVQGVNEQGEAVIEIKFDRIQMKVTGPMTADYDSSKDEPPTGMAATFAPLFKAMTKSAFEATMTSRGEIKDLKVPPDVLEALKSNPGAAQMGDLATPDGFQKDHAGCLYAPGKRAGEGRTLVEHCADQQSDRRQANDRNKLHLRRHEGRQGSHVRGLSSRDQDDRRRHGRK